ncbi:hypothetical protein SRHO_G00200480 [Serrasalmus rhombeus]
MTRHLRHLEEHIRRHVFCRAPPANVRCGRAFPAGRDSSAPHRQPYLKTDNIPTGADKSRGGPPMRRRVHGGEGGGREREHQRADRQGGR